MRTAIEPPRIDLRHDGVGENEWSPALRALPTVSPRALVAGATRIVVVTPHPDDETLGVGGTIAALAADGVAVVVVSLTDGEAAPSTLVDLAEVRRSEFAAALVHLAPKAGVVRLGLPDGDVAGYADDLTVGLAALLGPHDVVLAPLPDDGHPDHDTSGAAGAAAAAAAGARCWLYPVWAWHWHQPTATPINRGVRVVLSDDAWNAKQRAIACYTSQLDGDAPVVPAPAMVRYRRPFEVLVPA